MHAASKEPINPGRAEKGALFSWSSKNRFGYRRGQWFGDRKGLADHKGESQLGERELKER